MTGLRKAALAAITLLVAAASFTSFAESYRALLDWATRHGLHGIWAQAWPLQVDTFIAVGELALFVALADSWSLRSRAGAWTVTMLGLAVSVLGNVGHVNGDAANHLTAAVPPLAAAAALAVGLGVLKRVVAKRADRQSLTAASQPVEASAATIARLAAQPVGAGPAKPAARHTAKRRTSRRGGSPEVRQAEHARLLMEAQAELAREPDLSGAELGRRLGVSADTGLRLRSEIRAAQAQIPEAETVP